jgi:hydrogenase-4 component B
MFDADTSLTCFFISLLLFTAGAFGALVSDKKDRLSNLLGNILAIIASIFGIISSLSVLIFDSAFSYSLSSSLPLLSISLSIDRLSAFFIFIISLIALLASVYGVGYAKHYYKQYSLGALGFFYNFFILEMMLVVSSSNTMFFLIVWEMMSLTSYFLVVYENREKENIKAGSLYFIMTHIGTAFIMLAFLLIYKYTGSFDYTIIKQNIENVPPSAKDAIFFLALIGFGTKAGIIPFHIWLPKAHPAAPSHVSALMSGVMIKTGIYMLIRIFMDIMPAVQLWWGVVVLIIGCVSSVLGVLYALTEHDIKKLLAYHSIENIGIILLGFGSSLIFWSLKMEPFAIIALIAALFHTLNHAVFKALLFLGAGSVISQTHTRNIENYGGLIKCMPQTALFFLIGSMAISALPPFNGFFSEWMTFQSLFTGIGTLNTGVQWVFIFAAGSLAITGGLAAACFVKAFGTTFLARPRSEEARLSKETGVSPRIGMGALSLLCLIIGEFSGSVVKIISDVVHGLGIFNASDIPFSLSISSFKYTDGFASVSTPLIFFSLVLVVLLTFIIVQIFTKNRKVTIGRTWDCGTDLNGRMEITATGFSRSIITIFKGILRPSKQNVIEYREKSMPYFQKTNTVKLGVKDIYYTYFYHPAHAFVLKISGYVKKIQSGNTNAYVLYIFLILVALLLLIVI